MPSAAWSPHAPSVAVNAGFVQSDITVFLRAVADPYAIAHRGAATLASNRGSGELTQM
jgi:hypothetical protein